MIAQLPAPTTGRQFAVARLVMGVSARNVAHALGVSTVTIQRWERNATEIHPEVAFAWRLALGTCGLARRRDAQRQGVTADDLADTAPIFNCLGACRLLERHRKQFAMTPPNTGPVPNFMPFELPAEVQDARSLQAAFSLARDRLEAGHSIVAVLRDAVADDAHTAVRAIVKHGGDWQEVHQPDENARRQFAEAVEAVEAVEALASVQAKAKAASLAALDKIAGDA